MFYELVLARKEDEAVSFLKNNPGIDVNFQISSTEPFPLYIAALSGMTQVVKIILGHPGVEVNCKSYDDHVALSVACRRRRMDIVRFLLEDPRVDATLYDYKKRTPLFHSVLFENHDAVKFLIASGKDLGYVCKDRAQGSYGGVENPTVIELTTGLSRHEIAKLLNRFIDDPTQTSHEIRVELKFPDAVSAEIFALIIFLCDDLLQFKHKPDRYVGISLSSAATIRFLEISKRLPMELQMILCNRAVGSAKESITTKNSEPAFKSLVKTLLCS